MSAVFEISLAHKSHILHACHEKANYMRVGHVALNSAESDSSNTISYSQKPNTDIHERLTVEELVSAWQILESVKRNNRLSMRTQWEQSQEF